MAVHKTKTMIVKIIVMVVTTNMRSRVDAVSGKGYYAAAGDDKLGLAVAATVIEMVKVVCFGTRRGTI